jgi:hypothetical protein
MPLMFLHFVTTARPVRMFAVTLLAVLFVATATGTIAAGEDDATNEQPQQAASKYDHFLYLRHNVVDGAARTTSLVLAEITAEGFEQRDLLSKRNLSLNFMPVCVFGGRVYVVRMTDLIAIDVATGAATKVCPYVSSHTYDSGRIYGLVRSQGVGLVLRVFDVSSRTYRDVCTVGDASWEPPVALSPDGKRLAYFMIHQGPNIPTTFRLTTVDLRSGVAKQVGPDLFSMRFSTGGGMMTEGPTFTWLDPKTILLVRDESDQRGGRGMAGGAESEPLLATLDVETEEMTDMVKLPRFARRMYEPYLRPLGDDNVPRIVVGQLGQYRIDLKTRQLSEDDTLAGPFQWVRGPQPERLLFGEKELFRAQSVPDLAVSPDGCRVLWLTGRSSGNQLRYFSAFDDATRTVARGWLPTTDQGHRLPERSILLWIDSNDLEPAEAPEPPSDFKPFDEEPWS